jgi:Tol biopolymer transport system component
MIGLSTDNVNKNIWVHSTKTLFYMNTSNENENIWIAYVKKGKLQQALDLTHEGSENHALV